MAKARTHFLCRQCGGVQAQWMGKCPDCGEWDALEKFVEPKAPKAAVTVGADVAGAGSTDALTEWVAGAGVVAGPGDNQPGRAIPLCDVEAVNVPRIATGISEFDRVLGGGLVPGSVVLLGGDPGIGKSTLLLQAAGRLAGEGHRVLYITSEESAYQTRLRAERLFGSKNSGQGVESGIDGMTDLLVMADTHLGKVAEQARRTRPGVLVVDSIQMMHSANVDAAPGSVAQVRRCCTELVYLAKQSGMAVIVVGHMTKDGQLAGPKLLEHLVDVVLAFEGDRHHAHRVVRGMKNRYGATHEVGLFEMTGDGLMEVGQVGTAGDGQPVAGAVICPTMHGSRCLLVELQALTAPGFPGSTKRRTSGLDTSRVAMLIAVLETHGGVRLVDHDVFTSAVGGLRVTEPAGDLAICLAIAGAHMNRRLPGHVAVVGEVGLGGEIRTVPNLDQRRREVARLGYRSLLVPAGQAVEAGDLPVEGVSEALALLERAGISERSTADSQENPQ